VGIIFPVVEYTVEHGRLFLMVGCKRGEYSKVWDPSGKILCSVGYDTIPRCGIHLGIISTTKNNFVWFESFPFYV